MQADYKDCIDRIIHRYEGGYGWNKKDPGGPTNFGITCFDLAEHRGQKMDSMSRWAPLVKAMTLDEAEAIYKTKYARGVRFDELPAGTDVVLLDYGINSGNGRALRVARVITGQPAGTKMDQALFDALKAYDPLKFVNMICNERLKFMHAIRGGSAWAEFGKGWQARVDDLRKYATAVNTRAGVVPGSVIPPAPKATNSGPNLPTKTAAGSSTGAAAALHFLDFNWWYVGGAAAIVIVGFIAYAIWRDIKANKANETVVL